MARRNCVDCPWGTPCQVRCATCGCCNQQWEDGCVCPAETCGCTAGRAARTAPPARRWAGCGRREAGKSVPAFAYDAGASAVVDDLTDAEAASFMATLAEGRTDA